MHPPAALAPTTGDPEAGRKKNNTKKEKQKPTDTPQARDSERRAIPSEPDPDDEEASAPVASEELRELIAQMRVEMNELGRRLSAAAAAATASSALGPAGSVVSSLPPPSAAALPVASPSFFLSPSDCRLLFRSLSCFRPLCCWLSFVVCFFFVLLRESSSC